LLTIECVSVNVGCQVRLSVILPSLLPTNADSIAVILPIIYHRRRDLATGEVHAQLVILHMFAKETRAMPQHEIEIAERRRRDWLHREGR
jgi:hypothetical protein